MKGGRKVKNWNYDFTVPDQKKVRMIVYTDCKNEADDQFALAHHLMTPKFLVKGIVAGHFNGNPQEWGEGHTAEASYNEVHKVLKLMDVEDQFKVYKGSEYPLTDSTEYQPSDACDFIIEEALKDDPHPLYIACQGAITDLASAILKEPKICSRMTAIWIGGGQYPEGEKEFNLEMDIKAANVVMRSQMPLWQIPMNVYKQMAVTLAELQMHVKPCGEIGNYLFTQMVEFNTKAADFPWPHGEIWGLGDSPTVGVLLQESQKRDVYDVIPAPVFKEDESYDFSEKNRDIRVYKQVDARMILNDFYAKLYLNYHQ